MSWFREIAELGSSLATVAGFLGLLTGLWLGGLQFRRAQELDREVSAKAAYTGFLALSLQHVDLARGDERPENASDPAYQWYVRLMLMSFENILVACRQEEWKHAIRLHLRQHARFLESDHFVRQERDSYDPVLVAMIAQLTRDGGPRSAGARPSR